MSTLKLIGSMDGRDYYQPADVLNLLATDPQSLVSSTAFSGRPQTRIHTDFKDVVKIRAELELSADKAFPWAEAVLKQERILAVHHPRKTWFVSQTPDTGKILIGNISPYLEPLHMVFKKPPENKQQRRQYLTLLTSMFEKYLRLGKNLGYKLDEGLSNFAVDEVGEVFYLDDEYYKWDNFVAFAIMLGVFIRGYDWLDGIFIRGLSRQLHCLIDEIFVDPHCRTIVASQMQTLFMPSLHKEQLLKKFRAGLSTRPVAGAMHLANKKRLNARKNNKNRFYAVMGDIHGNDAALIRVLDFYRSGI